MIKFLLVSVLFVNYGTNFGSVSHSIRPFDSKEECESALSVVKTEFESMLIMKDSTFYGQTKHEISCKPYSLDK